MTDIDKYGELSESYCPSCEQLLDSTWVACPHCGNDLAPKNLKSTGGSAGRVECRHCLGTGKCGCYECKVFFAQRGLGKKLSGQWIPDRADYWARDNDQSVVCSLCYSAGS